MEEGEIQVLGVAEIQSRSLYYAYNNDFSCY